MDIDLLRASVARAFDATGPHPVWSDAHLLPDGTRRDSYDEEYSRVLNPARYQVIGARVDAWVSALTGLGLAGVETVDADRFADAAQTHDPVQVLVLTPRRQGAVPLLFAVRSVLAPRDSVVIGAGDPAAVVLDRIPDCGCDACDSGSADLLTTLDDGVLDVVTGAVVHVVANGTTIVGRRDGWSASGSGPGRIESGDRIEAAIAAVRSGAWAGPSIHGVPWW